MTPATLIEKKLEEFQKTFPTGLFAAYGLEDTKAVAVFIEQSIRDGILLGIEMSTGAVPVDTYTPHNNLEEEYRAGKQMQREDTIEALEQLKSEVV